MRFAYTATGNPARLYYLILVSVARGRLGRMIRRSPGVNGGREVDVGDEVC